MKLSGSIAARGAHRRRAQRRPVVGDQILDDRQLVDRLQRAQRRHRLDAEVAVAVQRSAASAPSRAPAGASAEICASAMIA